MTASTSSRRRRISDRLIMDVASSLTDRDRQILRLLRWHRVLTTTQIHLMFFGNRNTAQHRMTRLHDLRLVARFRPQRCGRDGEYHYVLDVLGAYVVAAMANRGPVREIPMRWRTDWAMSIATSQRLAHTVGANDLFVRLVAAARQRPDAELTTWWGERYCTDRLGEVVRPDGLGVWREGDATVVFCLEYDRGSEQLGRLAKKADDYARLEEASGWAFWVLVVRGRPSCSTAWPGPPGPGRPLPPGRGRGGELTTTDLHGSDGRALMGGSAKKKEAAMRCVLYLRVSTREQAEKGEGEEGFSIPAQREACTRHIRDASWELVEGIHALMAEF